MLRRLTKPALFVTGTDTAVGKSVVASAIAERLHQSSGRRVGVFKPVASGCDLRDGLIVNEDAERLAAAVGNRLPRDVICPQQYVTPLTPAVAAQIEDRPLDWRVIQAALDRVEAESDVIIIEGAGGIFAPLDDDHTVLSVIVALGAPALCVSRPGLGTINHTMLTIETMRRHQVPIAGVVVNRFPVAAGLAERTNLAQIAKWSNVPVLCVVPEAYFVGYAVPPEVAQSVAGVDWLALCK